MSKDDERKVVHVETDHDKGDSGLEIAAKMLTLGPFGALAVNEGGHNAKVVLDDGSVGTSKHQSSEADAVSKAIKDAHKK
jgi:hypothetical protein